MYLRPAIMPPLHQTDKKIKITTIYIFFSLNFSTVHAKFLPKFMRQNKYMVTFLIYLRHKQCEQVIEKSCSLKKKMLQKNP